MSQRTIRHQWSSRTKKGITLPKRFEFLRKAKFVALIQRIEGGKTQWTIELKPAEGKKLFLASAIIADLELKLKKSNARICELQAELFEAKVLLAATARANQQLMANIEDESLKGREPAKGESVLVKFGSGDVNLNRKPYPGSACSAN